MRHTIGVLVENHAGVLARVAGLFFARGYNIKSLAVGETEDSTISRMTIVVDGDDKVLLQIVRQLDKLPEALKVQDLTRDESIERELALVKVKVTAKTRAEIMQIVNTFRAKVVDVSGSSITIEITGNESKIDALVELMLEYGVLEVVNTGVVSISRTSVLAYEEPKQTTKKTTTKKKAAAKKKVTK